jgi:predicted nucleic acid-binding Zn ribbon protein
MGNKDILEKERRKGRKKLVNYSLVLTLDLLNLGSIYRVAEL